MTKNDLRSGIFVYEVPMGYCVKMMYKDYEISSAADGGDTIVFNKQGGKVKEFYGTGAEQIAQCVEYINSL